MNYNDSSECGIICAERAKGGLAVTGCCQLKSGAGCAWKPGSHSVTEGTGIAVTCKKGKKKIRIFSIDLFLSFLNSDLGLLSFLGVFRDSLPSLNFILLRPWCF